MANAVDLQQSVKAHSIAGRKIETCSNAGRDIVNLFDGIDSIDAELLAAVERRTELAKLVARAEAARGDRPDPVQEEKIVARFGELGQEGHSLGRLLNRLAAG